MSKEELNIKEMSFMERRQRLINELGQSKIKKKSEGQDFRYIDLQDIKEVLDPLKLKYGITDFVSFEDYGTPSGKPCIKLFDLWNLSTEPQLVFYLPGVAIVDDYNGSIIQRVGAYSTYYRRYLLMLAYDIAAQDEIDAAPASEVVDLKIPSSIPEMPNDWVDPQSVTSQTVQNENLDNDNQVYHQESFLASLDSLIDAKEETTVNTTNSKNYILTNGPYEGCNLENVEIMDPNYLRSLAEDDNVDASAAKNYLEQQL